MTGDRAVAGYRDTTRALEHYTAQLSEARRLERERADLERWLATRRRCHS